MSEPFNFEGPLQASCSIESRRQTITPIVQLVFDGQQLSVCKEEWSPSVDQEEPEPPHIKEEQEELWTSQEGEQLPGLEEADIIKSPLHPVPVKSEDDEEKWSSQLHPTQPEENRETEPLASISDGQMEAEADGEDSGESEAARNLDPAGGLESPREDQPLSTDCSGSETEDSDDWKETRNIKAHMRCQSGERSFSCTVCKKGFKQKSSLKRHMRCHTGDVLFSCTVCEKGFKLKSSLNRHMRCHNGENPFSCTVCEKDFTNKIHLKVHMRCHAEESSFSCVVCKKVFTQQNYLKVHMRCHTMAIANIKKFSKLSFEQKLRIVDQGRPTPDLIYLHQKKGQKITRTFQVSWYSKKDWLCGCAESSRLFCFPCLLFAPNQSFWTKDGYEDLNNLPTALLKHEKSASHIHSQIALKTFGKSRVDVALNEQRRLDIGEHNKKVKENRLILQRLICAMCYLAKQGLAFRDNDESASSRNRGDYVELLDVLAEKDEKLERHLQTSTVFSGTSSRIQKDLIEAIADVLRSDIQREIDAAPFVAVAVDEMADPTSRAQVSVVLRYVHSGEVKEAFVGFDDAGEDARSAAMADYVLGVLGKCNCVHKLVAHTYDGASVMASQLNGVQEKIREVVPEATFTHSLAHKLNAVLSQSAKAIPECKVFFKTLDGLASFFSKSAKRAHLLDEVVKRRLPRAAPTRWTSSSRLVQTASFCQTDLREMFRIVCSNCDNWDGETLAMASGFDLWLSDASTVFLLMAYEGFFSETETLFRVLRSKDMDIGFCRTYIQDTVTSMERQQQNFDGFYDQFEQRCAELNVKDASRGNQQAKESKKKLYSDILDNILLQMNCRFASLDELQFLGLVDCAKFSDMLLHFDEEKLKSLSKYTKYFDFVRLKSDLGGLYGSQMVRGKSPAQLLRFLAEHDLEETVPEASKLLKLVLTIPTTTAASVEPSCSALKRIETYSRRSTAQRRLPSLALLSIEKERLSKLQATKDVFYNRVTEVFIQKDRRMDFMYK